MPRSKRRKRKTTASANRRVFAGMVSQWGFRRKDYPHAAPEDLVRLIIRCARSRGSQAVLRAERNQRSDPFLLVEGRYVR